MPQDARSFQREAAPVAELLCSVNDSFYETYEFNKDWYREGGHKAKGSGAFRQKWGLDLSKVEMSRESGKHRLTWGGDLVEVQNHILYYIVSNSIENEPTLNDFFDYEVVNRERVTRNITNAWRDEFALNDPVNGSPKERMRIAEWRIIMCYYAVYKSISALMRTRFDDSWSHSDMWMKHMNKFVDELKGDLYAYPFMFFPRNSGPHSTKWFDWTVPYPIQDHLRSEEQATLQENAERCLSSIHSDIRKIAPNGTFVTFYDLLHHLRTWANYQHGGIFSRLYGEGYIQMTDEALRLITFTGMTIAEVGLIQALGLDYIKSEYKSYQESCEAGKVPDAAHFIDRRMHVYEQAF
jgi:hypothetical protein